MNGMRDKLKHPGDLWNYAHKRETILFCVWVWFFFLFLILEKKKIDSDNRPIFDGKTVGLLLSLFCFGVVCLVCFVFRRMSGIQKIVKLSINIINI